MMEGGIPVPIWIFALLALVVLLVIWYIKEIM